MDNEEFIVALMKGVGEFDQHLVRSHAGLVAVMVLHHPVMPDGDFGTVFVCDFADVCSFGAVWIRRVVVVSRWVQVPYGQLAFNGTTTTSLPSYRQKHPSPCSHASGNYFAKCSYTLTSPP